MSNRRNLFRTLPTRVGSDATDYYDVDGDPNALDDSTRSFYWGFSLRVMGALCCVGFAYILCALLCQ